MVSSTPAHPSFSSFIPSQPLPPTASRGCLLLGSHLLPLHPALLAACMRAGEEELQTEAELGVYMFDLAARGRPEVRAVGGSCLLDLDLAGLSASCLDELHRSFDREGFDAGEVGA